MTFPKIYLGTIWSSKSLSIKFDVTMATTCINVLPNKVLLNSSIGKNMHDAYGMSKPNFINNFSVLKKCRNKFDCLIHEMLIIQGLKPTLNSIRATLFT